MPRLSADSWEDIGRRVAEARSLAGITQSELAGLLGLDRTAVTRIESGDRRIDAVELARLAGVMGLPVDWFLTESAPALLSRRRGRIEAGHHAQADVLLERLARDVELLSESGTLDLPHRQPLRFPADLEEAEEAAHQVRQALGAQEGPLTEIAQFAGSLGLMVFSLSLGGPTEYDGGYVALAGGGLALVSGDAPAGRRRFTAAHELGHHVFADEFASDLAVGSSESGRERLIDAFAIHLLLPRSSVMAEWAELAGEEDPRPALLRLAVRYRVSWSAAVAQAATLHLIPRSRVASLQAQSPSRAELLEAGLLVVEELRPPTVPPVFARAVLAAYRRSLLSPGRAVEMLHGAVTEDDLPQPSDVPLDAYRFELQPLE